MAVIRPRYFPQGIATDAAFCDRENERALLKTRIEAHEHSVLVAPRRYGKTSLMTQVLFENDFSGLSIDFFFVLTHAEVVSLIVSHISKLMLSMMPKSAAAAKRMLEYLSALHPKLSFNLFGQQLEINVHQPDDKSITEVLLALDDLAQKTKKTCVLIFDEFQQIGELNESHSIEASIRHAVERSKQVSYIFCGSKRHLLDEMFSNRSRPLYHLCDLMSIDRIPSPYYYEFLKKLSKKNWGKLISDDAIAEILELTNNHPYYVNALCRNLWRGDLPPDTVNVFNSWSTYVKQQSPWIISDISKITLNRRKVLQALAKQPIKQPHSLQFTSQLSVSPGSIRKILEDLFALDLVYVDQDGYTRVLDPAIEFYLNHHD